jgi:ribosome-binding ATPase YchF (GTP1/OBG family)
MRAIHDALGAGRSVRSLGLGAEVLALLSGYALLTVKPEVVVLSRDDARAGEPVPPAIAELALAEAGAIVPLCARLEAELGELEPDERVQFMREMGIETAGTDRFIREVYAALGLVSFFTTEGKELRAWTVRSGTTAVKAAGRIHTDMERGFIRAEVVPSGEPGARPRQVGRDYVVRDGDVLTIRFNV